MSNYNYYNNLTNRFKKKGSIGQKDKTHRPAFDKSVYEGYNGEKTKSYTPAYEYKPGYGNTQNRWLETNSHRGDNSLYKPKISEKEKPIYKKAGFQENNLIKDGFNVSNPSFKDDPWFEITPPSTTYDPGFLISDNPENPWDNTFKKKAQNQWYNKIAHGSFKDDDWFNSMVKNQVGNAEAWNVKASPKAWSQTLGISEGTYRRNLIFLGRVVSPEDIGNITYGYLGKAAGFSDEMLYIGSMGNQAWTHITRDWDNEFADHEFIQLGIDLYNGMNIEVRYGKG